MTCRQHVSDMSTTFPTKMSKEGKLIGGLCGLFHRSVYQDIDSLSMIPIGGTILILQLLDVLLDVTKMTKSFHEFDFTNIQNICETSFSQSRRIIPFPNLHERG